MEHLWPINDCILFRAWSKTAHRKSYYRRTKFLGKELAQRAQQVAAEQSSRRRNWRRKEGGHRQESHTFHEDLRRQMCDACSNNKLRDVSLAFARVASGRGGPLTVRRGSSLEKFGESNVSVSDGSEGQAESVTERHAHTERSSGILFSPELRQSRIAGNCSSEWNKSLLQFTNVAQIAVTIHQLDEIFRNFGRNTRRLYCAARMRMRQRRNVKSQRNVWTN